MVGAYRESSNTTGVNGDQGDDSAFNSGAVYAFSLAALGTNYCVAITNSTGGPALIRGCTSASISLNVFSLSAGLSLGESSASKPASGPPSSPGVVYAQTRAPTQGAP